jgi:DNA-binding beta-propeller fold protein YncE
MARAARAGWWTPRLRIDAGSPRITRRGRALCVLLCFGLILVLPACAGLGGWGSAEEPIEPIFFPPAPEEPRIQFLTYYSSDLDVLPQQSSFRRFIVGERDGLGLSKPYGVAIHDAQILVCDTIAGAVAVFDLRAQTFDVLGADRNGRLRKPINIAVDEDGTRYVADTGVRRIMIYGPDNEFDRALGDPETWTPTDVAIAEKRLYVSDLMNEQIVVLEKATGQEIARIDGTGGDSREQFLPTNIDLDDDRNLYVSDTGNARVLEFDRRGRLLKQFGSLGLQRGKFVRPKGVAVDREGRLYVVDASHQFVQIFDRDGNLLLFFGGAGNHLGALNLPAKVIIDYDNLGLFAEFVAPGREIEYLILVTSQYGPHKVNVFGFLKQTESD